MGTIPAGTVSTNAVPANSAVGVTWLDEHETPQVSWIDGGGTCTHRILRHERIHGDAQRGEVHAGTSAEQILTDCQADGRTVFLVRPIRPILVKPGLLPSLYLKANRSGLQLMARVVLPATLDPETQRAMTLYLHGDIYSTSDQWQLLRIENPAQQLAQEAELYQLKNADLPPLNTRGAYLDYIIVNAWGGVGVVQVTLDTLEIAGVVEANRNSQIPEAAAVSVTHPVASDEAFAAVGTIPGNGAVNGVFSNGVPGTNSQSMAGSVQSVAERGSSPAAVANESTHPFPVAAPQAVLASPNTRVGSGLEDISSLPQSTPSTDIRPLPDGETQVGDAPDIPPAQLEAKKHTIQFRDTALYIDEYPIFVRAIRHRGEALETLSRLNFNTVWLSSPPTIEMEAEARQLNIWFISPLPIPAQDWGQDVSRLTRPSDRYTFNRVLAWDLGSTPRAASVQKKPDSTLFDVAQKQVDWVRSIPESILPKRPVAAAPDQNIRGYQKLYDVLLFNRNPISSTQDIEFYSRWLRLVSNQGGLEQPFWTTVPTEYSPRLRQQWLLAEAVRQGISPSAARVPSTLPTEQIRLMAYTAVTSGSRGLLFESTTSLEGTDQETESRRKSLALINLELLLFEQWLAQGNSVSTISTNKAFVKGKEISVERSRLLIPLCMEPNSQYVPGVGAATNVETMPMGVPDTYDCWKIAPNGLEHQPCTRAAGGMRLQLEEVPLASTYLLTQNQNMLNKQSKRCRKYGLTLTNAMLDVAEVRMRGFLQAHGSTELQGADAEWYHQSQEFLANARRALQNQEFSLAFQQAQRAVRPVCYTENETWKRRVAPFGNPNSLPPLVSFRSMPLLDTWLKLTEGKVPGTNRLPTGDMEDLPTMVRAGWTQQKPGYAIPHITTKAQVDASMAHSGLHSLKLEVAFPESEKDTMAPPVLDTPPVRMHSPPISLGPAGTIYQVEAWVNIPKGLTRSIDGLKITDSNSGDVLAERITKTSGWQKIRFQRITTSDQPVQLEISLSGYGTAWVDDVTICPLTPKETTP